MPQVNELYTFNFKICYTERNFEFSLNPDTTIKNFIKFIKNYILENEPNPDCDIEILETGQYNNINGRDPELAPKINYHNEYTLRDVYGHRWRNTSFYIRFIQNNQNSNHQ
jgi:hypothetical protein